MQRNSPMLGAASGSRSRRRTSKRSFACVTQGLALEASELNNIFDLFYQLERTVDRTGRGLGIGLSLVRRLIEMHGGSVEVVSEGPGRGSEFILRLPLLSTANSPCDQRLSEIDKAREIVLDHALQATFPASDPSS